MPISEFMARQASQPSGWFGRLFMGHLLNRSNTRGNKLNDLFLAGSSGWPKGAGTGDQTGWKIGAEVWVRHRHAACRLCGKGIFPLLAGADFISPASGWICA